METEILVQQTEFIKLMKMSKGFQWEVKIIPKKDQTDKELTKRLEEINNDLSVKFGGSDL